MCHLGRHALTSGAFATRHAARRRYHPLGRFREVLARRNTLNAGGVPPRTPCGAQPPSWRAFVRTLPRWYNLGR